MAVSHHPPPPLSEYPWMTQLPCSSMDHPWMESATTPPVRVSVEDAVTLSILGPSMDGSQLPPPQSEYPWITDNAITLSICGPSTDGSQPPTPPVRVSVDDAVTQSIRGPSMDGSQPPPPPPMSEYPWMTQLP